MLPRLSTVSVLDCPGWASFSSSDVMILLTCCNGLFPQVSPINSLTCIFWNIFLKYSLKELLVLTVGLHTHSSLLLALSLRSLATEEDAVFCWETAEAFPPLQTVFTRFAFGLEEMRQQKRRWQQPFRGSGHTPLIISSYSPMFRNLVWQTQVWKAVSPVLKSFNHLLISPISVTKRNYRWQDLKLSFQA